MFHFNFHVTGLSAEEKRQLNRIEQKLDALFQQEKAELMMLAELKTQVEKNTQIEESAVTLIGGIAAQLADAKNDPAAIQALADELAKSGGDLAAAITANATPAP